MERITLIIKVVPYVSDMPWHALRFAKTAMTLLSPAACKHILLVVQIKNA